MDDDKDADHEDIRAFARGLIGNRGGEEHALAYANRRAHALRKYGNNDGYDAWIRVARMIERSRGGAGRKP